MDDMSLERSRLMKFDCVLGPQNAFQSLRPRLTIPSAIEAHLTVTFDTDVKLHLLHVSLLPSPRHARLPFHSLTSFWSGQIVAR